jgi:hypothetical protein
LLAQGLGANLAGADGGLEAAVVRAALAQVLTSSAAKKPLNDMEASPLVRRFLVSALHLRLALDLGEHLEAAAPGYRSFRQGMGELRDWVAGAAAGTVEQPVLQPEDWQGLPGWTWVTREMEAMFARLKNV